MAGQEAMEGAGKAGGQEEVEAVPASSCSVGRSVGRPLTITIRNSRRQAGRKATSKQAARPQAPSQLAAKALAAPMGCEIGTSKQVRRAANDVDRPSSRN